MVNFPQEKKSFFKTIYFYLLVIIGLLLAISTVLISKQKDTVAPQSITNPQQINSTPVFQYNTQKAKMLLTQYIRDDIKADFLPEKIEVKQGLSIDGQEEDIKYQFGSQFSSNNDLFSTNFHYKEGTNDPNDFTIYIQLESVQENNLTSTLANSISSSYFNNPYIITSCITKDNSSLCESFESKSEEKRGYGLIFINDGGKFIPILFTCSVPKTSRDYTIQKSCIVQ